MICTFRTNFKTIMLYEYVIQNELFSTDFSGSMLRIIITERQFDVF